MMGAEAAEHVVYPEMHGHIAGAHRKATLVIVWFSQYRVAILGKLCVLCLALQFTVATRHS